MLTLGQQAGSVGRLDAGCQIGTRPAGASRREVNAGEALFYRSKQRQGRWLATAMVRRGSGLAGEAEEAGEATCSRRRGTAGKQRRSARGRLMQSSGRDLAKGATRDLAWLAAGCRARRRGDDRIQGGGGAKADGSGRGMLIPRRRTSNDSGELLRSQTVAAGGSTAAQVKRGRRGARGKCEVTGGAWG